VFYYLNFSDGCINTHNTLHVNENIFVEAKKKFLTNCVKNKRFKKNIYIFYSKHISLKTTTTSKKFLSLKIISNCLKKFIHRYGVLHTTGSTIQHLKNYIYVYQILRKTHISHSNISSIMLFLLHKTYKIEILNEVFN